MAEVPTEIVALIQRATAFVAELKAFGYGETSDKAMPGSYDPFVAALEAARERLIDKALDQDNG